MLNFHIFSEDEGLTKAQLTAVENAMEGFVETDVALGVELIFVPEEEIRRLNRETRAVDKVTDVLSYPTLDGIKGQPIFGEDYPYDVDENGVLLLGSIVICQQRAKEQANEYGHSYERELHYLLVHGIMHCLGYDHMTDAEKAEMREKEEFVLGKLGITR